MSRVHQKPIRVLVVDDSAIMRRLIIDIINAEDDFAVIGMARNGQDGIEKVLAL